MNAVTNGILIISAASVTLGAIHLRMCFQPRNRAAHILFVVASFAIAIYSLFERAMMMATTPAEYGELLRWAHVFVWMVVVSLAWFVHLYLRAGRLWMLWGITIFRTIALILNFTSPLNLNYLEISVIRQVSILGEPLSVAVGTANPLMLVGNLSLLFLLGFCIDAAVSLWRRRERRLALTLGVGIVVFATSAFVIAVSVLWGIAAVPLISGPFFLGIIISMGYEMTLDVQRSAEIAHELGESKVALSETLQHLGLSAAAANVGVWTRSLDGDIIWASDKWRELLEFEPTAHVSFDDYLQKIYVEDRDRIATTLRFLRTDGETYEAEFRVVLQNGEIRWLAAYGRLESVGNSALIRSATVDITKRKVAEGSNEILAAVVESSDDAILTKTLDGLITTWNRGAQKMYGYTASEMIGRHVSVLVPDERARELMEILERVGRGVSLDHLETVRVAKDGRRINVSLTVSLIRDVGGRIIGASTIARDITKRKAAEEGLIESEARLSGVLGSAMDAIISVDEDHNVILFNSAAEEMFGLKAGKAIGERLDNFIPERFRGGHAEHIRSFGRTKVTKRSMSKRMPIFGRRATGEEFPIEASISQVHVKGKVIYTVILRDITLKLKADEEFRQSEERFRNMADSAPVLIWMSGVDRLCTYFNQGWLDYTGRTMDQEFGNGWAEGVHADDYGHCLSVYNAAFDRREKFRMEYRLRRFDGEFRWFYDVGTPRFASEGVFLGYIGSCTDIHDRKEADEALQGLSQNLIRAQEEERSRVARELHDGLSQSLALLSIQLSRLERKSDEPVYIKSQVTDLTSQIDRLSADVHRISHELHPAKLEQLGLKAALLGFCHELENAHRIKITVEADGIPGELPNDISLCMYRITQESLQNVVKHSGASNAQVEINTAENELCVVVTDNGSGFDTEAKKTRESLGLISMSERIRSVNGTISVESVVGAGTKIIARVPLPAD